MKVLLGKSPSLLSLSKVENLRLLLTLLVGFAGCLTQLRAIECVVDIRRNYPPALSCSSPPRCRASDRCICLSAPLPSDSAGGPSSIAVPPRTLRQRARLDLPFRTSTISPPCDTSSKLCNPDMAKIWCTSTTSCLSNSFHSCQ